MNNWFWNGQLALVPGAISDVCLSTSSRISVPAESATLLPEKAFPAMTNLATLANRSLQFVLIASAAASLSSIQPGRALELFSFDSSLTAKKRSSIGFTKGNLFTTGSSQLMVNSLGAQFVDPGAPSSITVILWDATGASLLARASVANTDQLISGYRYKTLGTPVTLYANTTYVIGAFLPSGVKFWDGNDNPTNPALDTNPYSSTYVTLNKAVYNYGSTLAFPAQDGNSPQDAAYSGRWAPANASFDSLRLQSVPGPLPVFGAMAAHAWSRQLRKRSRGAE
jgi:hypothetical protein